MLPTPFIPATLVVDDEQRGDVGEDIVEGTRIVRVGGQARLGLQNHAHGADRGEAAIPTGGGQLHVPVIHPGDYGSKDVGLETIRVQQIVLEQLAGPVGFGKYLQRQIRMRPVGQQCQPILQLPGQINDISAAADRGFIRISSRIRVAWRRRLFRSGAADRQNYGNRER